jgi:uncharacterized membrane protein (DUF485 family)
MSTSTQAQVDQRSDWEGLERSPEFRELAATRRRFVIPALVVFVVWFGGFLVLTAYARGFMAQRPFGWISWAYLLALSLIVMTWLITWLYLRWSERRLAPLADRTAGANAEREP